ncbi:hypothetical protein MAP00_003963 [Monascus purpureus]|nr:hypothetical protein MAP00_003963 [Monascus purpureus]
MASSFKVLIAGGSITGLLLAIMLERNNIDYLVLETYPEIAPQTGASIGLLPHGFRILGQLECYKALCEYVRDYSVQYMVSEAQR